MTFIELCRAVHSEAGLSGDGPTAIAGQVGMNRKIIEWVRGAYQDIILMREWDWLWKKTYIDVSPSQSLIVLKEFGISDVGRIIAKSVQIKRQDGSFAAVPFDPDYSTLDSKFLLSDPSEPAFITRYPNGDLRLYPTPSDFVSLSFEYYRDRHDLDNDTSEPLIPEPFRYVIVWKALVRYAAHDSAGELLPHAQSMFSEVLQRMEQRHRAPISRGAFPIDGLGFSSSIDLGGHFV